MDQMTLFDFSQIRVIPDEKKEKNISFKVGEKFKEDLEFIARAKRITIAALCFEYCVKGYVEDYGRVQMCQNRSGKTLRELMARK